MCLENCQNVKFEAKVTKLSTSHFKNVRIIDKVKVSGDANH
ncbi:hypothetical protein T09_9093 [Trichinella sp. T9]|nr:hypothetical protein T09_9093 [Trichinella sp. T9]